MSNGATHGDRRGGAWRVAGQLPMVIAPSPEPSVTHLRVFGEVIGDFAVVV